MPRRGRPPGRRPRPPRDRSCSTCGENHQGDGAGQLPGYFGHGNLGEMDGPEFYPDPVTGRPNGPRWGRRGNRGIGPQGNTNQDVVANAWGSGNDSGFEVWNNGQLVASGGDRLGRGAGPQGRGDFAFDFDDEGYYSDDLDEFGGGPFGRGPPLGPAGDPFGRGPRRGPGRFPPSMGLDGIPPWLFDEFGGDDDDFDDHGMMGPFGVRSPGRRGGGPGRSGRSGVRVTRHGGAIVVDNEFGGPPRGGGGRSGLDLGPDDDYSDYDSGYDDEIAGGSFAGRTGDRVMRLRNGGTLRIHRGW
ncbi:hypothetical protein CLAIMM_07477 [Cladophialophora immunda]|nr:hypothetical protein CLAIMM_07477 [Cladophialophora immunda]